jgi:hypothetical protein
MDDARQLLQGRVLGTAELEEIRGLMARHPEVSRKR